jgi:hypothetical protein
MMQQSLALPHPSDENLSLVPVDAEQRRIVAPGLLLQHPNCVVPTWLQPSLQFSLLMAFLT